MKDILLINVYGEDKPGVTHAVTTVLAKYAATVLDIGQAVIHDQLNLGILTALPSAPQTSLITEEIKVALEQLEMKAKFLPISEQHYQDWVEQQGKPKAYSDTSLQKN